MAGIHFTEGSHLQDTIYGKIEAPVRMFIEKRGEAFEAESTLPKLFAMEKSTHFGETLGGMTSMNNWEAVTEGAEFPQNDWQESYKKIVEHYEFKSRFTITRKMMDDSKVIDLKKQPLAFTAAYYRTREQLGAAILGKALTVSSGTTPSVSVKFGAMTMSLKGADGKCLFAEDHPSKTGGAAQSNRYSDAFSEDALSAAETAMQGFTDDNGNILDLAPDTIIIPNEYSLKKAVFAAIGADKDPATANNGFNYQFGRWNVIINPYLNKYIASGGKPWMLLDSRYNQEYLGTVWFDRVAMEVDNHIDRDTGNAVWTGYARFGAHVNDWRAYICGGVSATGALISD